jgi:hypothetical protein
MIELVPFKAEHYASMIIQPEQAHVRGWLTPEQARALEGPWAASLVEGNKVWACGGVVEYWKNRGEAWALISGDCGVKFTRMVRLTKKWLDDCDIRRIEAAVVGQGTAWIRGRRLLWLLGFDLRNHWHAEAYCPDGRNATLFAKVKRHG